MILDTEDYSSDVAPYILKLFKITLDTSKIDRMLDAIKYHPSMSGVFETLAARTYLVEQEPNKNYGITTTLDFIWGDWGQSVLPDASYEIYLYTDVTWSKTYKVFIENLMWNFTGYVGQEKVLTKKGKIALDKSEIPVDSRTAKQVLLKATVQALKDIQKLLDTPATHKKWLEAIDYELQTSTSFKEDVKMTKNQMSLFRQSFVRIARLQPSLREDLRAISAYLIQRQVEAADPGDLHTFSMDKRSFLPFIEKVLRNPPPAWRSMLDPDKVDLKKLASITYTVLSKPSAWRVLKDWDEEELVGTVLNNARNYIGVASLSDI